MLNLTYKGTIGGLLQYLKEIAECPQCKGKGWYNVSDGQGCVDAEYCYCQEQTIQEKMEWETFKTSVVKDILRPGWQMGIVFIMMLILLLLALVISK